MISCLGTHALVCSMPEHAYRREKLFLPAPALAGAARGRLLYFLDCAFQCACGGAQRRALSDTLGYFLDRLQRRAWFRGYLLHGFIQSGLFRGGGFISSGFVSIAFFH